MNTGMERFDRLGAPFNTRWRIAAVAGVVLAVNLVAQLGGGLMIGLYVALSGKALPTSSEAAMASVPPLLNFALVNVAIISLIAGVLLGVGLITKQPLRTLFTAAPTFRFKRFGLGLVVTFAALAAFTVTQALVSPSAVAFGYDASKFWPALALVLLLTPLQCLAEELVFRGWLLQALSGRGRALAVAVSSTIFASLHLLNAEALKSGLGFSVLAYGGFGVFFCLIAMRERGLELGWGVHTANNVFSMVLVSESVSSLPMPSLFTETEFSPAVSTLTEYALFVVVLVLTQRLWPALRAPTTIEPARMNTQVA